LTRINADRGGKGALPSPPLPPFLCVSKVVVDLCSSPLLRASVVISFAQVNQQQQIGVAKGPAILLLLAVAIFLAGAVRYYRHENFSLVQIGYCLVALMVSLVVLLIFDYTLHHAKIVAIMVLVFIVLFLVASPAFCVGMGIGLAGMVVVQGRG
jgi:hypothetical protein